MASPIQYAFRAAVSQFWLAYVTLAGEWAAVQLLHVLVSCPVLVGKTWGGTLPSCLLTGGYGRARMRAGWGPRCGGGALSALPFFESFRSRFCPRILLPGWLMKLLLGSERGNFRRLSCGLPVSWCPRLGRAFFFHFFLPSIF
jgi:hypothetical protein